MATPPKSPKSAPAKPAVKAAKAAAAAKPPEESVVHSTEIAAAPVVEAAAPVAEVAAPVVEAAAKAVETVVEAVTEAAKPVKAVIAKAAGKAPEEVFKGVETFLEFSRDNAILLVATGNELALGLHKLSLSLLDWSAESCDKGVAATSALLSAKTVEEAIDVSQSLAKDSLQQFLKEGSELGALSTKLFEDTFAPLPGRLAANVEKLASQAH